MTMTHGYQPKPMPEGAMPPMERAAPLQPRHQQLFDALVQARRAHDEKPCESTHIAKRAAVQAVHKWIEHDGHLVQQIKQAKVGGLMTRVQVLETDLAAHRAVIDPRDVKLVDTAGVLRLDMNGHRVFMNKEQARDLFGRLGAMLYLPEYSDLECDYAPEDSLRISHDRLGRYAEVQCVEDRDCMIDSRDIMVNLSSDKALKAAIALAAVSLEVRKNGE